MPGCQWGFVFMPPIQLSRRERASLRKLLEGPRQPGDIPSDHEEKFVNYDLVRKQVLLLYITPLGQIELLRQRFRDIKRQEPARRFLPGTPLLPPFRRNPLLTSSVADGA